MHRNGSPPAIYSTDEIRSHFLVTLPIHPEMQGVLRPIRQVTPQVTPQVLAILKAAERAQNRAALQEALKLTDREHFRTFYLEPMLAAGWLEMTIPDKPRSSKQQYRTTEIGKRILRAGAAE